MNRRPLILYVDDELSFHIIMKHVLKRNCDVEFAINGKDALELLKDKKYDIILMDINMPVMNGNECARYIKDENPDQYIIAMTALDITEFQKEHFDNYYRKPIAVLELENKLLKIYEWLLKNH